MSYNFNIPVIDTDSITITKQDMSEFSQDEINKLTEELNSISDSGINWDFEFYIPKLITVKSKNYILDYGNGKVTIKGSSLKATLKCPAMKEYINRTIGTILDETYKYKEIYQEYVNEILNLKDIKRFAVKKTLTEKVLNPQRTTEQKVFDALEVTGLDYQMGDKVYMFFKKDNSLSLIENFDGDYNIDRLMKNLYDTAMCFETIIDKNLFINYSLKKNKKLLAF